MDTIRKEPKQCTKRSCRTIIPPPEPDKQDFVTCLQCQLKDAASKATRKWKRDGTSASAAPKEAGVNATSSASKESENRPKDLDDTDLVSMSFLYQIVIDSLKAC